MRNNLIGITLCFLIWFSVCWTESMAQNHSDGKSEWVYYNKKGKLEYKTTARGDRILDFSHAGYMGGGVKIPDVTVKISVSPTGGDDTRMIQEAIDKVSSLQPEGNFRGTVFLEPGIYQVSQSLVISADGVVLRGSGSGLNGESTSMIRMTGSPFNAISIRKSRGNGENVNDQDSGEMPGGKMTGRYVPSGSKTFSVEDASQFRKGDLISLDKPVTKAWVRFMEMHDLVRDGKPQTWLAEGSLLSSERRIAEITGNSITVDVPLSDSYDMAFLEPEGVVVRIIEQPDRVKQSGVENLRIISPEQPYSHEQKHFTALRISGEDCWARDLFIEETMNSVAVGGARITIQQVTVQRRAIHQGSSRPAEFAPNGQQVLVDRCRVLADNVWFVATGARVSGPIVILNCEFTGDQRAESHQRWSTGLLYDNVKAINGGIDLRNRGSMGSGHGWSMGWGVAWNCVAKNYIIQNPPGAHNWMIGCIGESRREKRPFNGKNDLPEGTVDSHGNPVKPVSLYLAQLEDRLGKNALKNIGYETSHGNYHSHTR